MQFWLVFLLYLWGIETTSFGFSLKEITNFYSTYEALKRYKLFNTVITLFLFLLYLWGIETAHSICPAGLFLSFLLYLWGIETQSFHCHFVKIAYFYSTYEALKQEKWVKKRGQSQIFTLPMRHWNCLVVLSLFRTAVLNFYSTYEALKLLFKFLLRNELS